MTVMLLLLKNSQVKKGSEMVHCYDAAASSFVAKVRCDVFAHFKAVTVEHYSSLQN
jgi:hypothetical protein